MGAVLSGLDAAINGRPIGQAMLQGAINGAIGGAIGGAVYGTAAAFLGEAAAPVLTVVGLGLSVYGIAESIQDGNYFTAVYSAVMAFQSATDLYNMMQNTQSSGVAYAAEPGDGKGIDASPSSSSSVSGTGNKDIEIKMRNEILETTAGTSSDSSWGVDVTLSVSAYGQGTTFSAGGIEQDTFTFFDLAGGSLDVSIGLIPSPNVGSGEIGVGLGDFLGVGIFSTPSESGGYILGGITVHLGFGVGTPVYFSRTNPTRNIDLNYKRRAIGDWVENPD